MPDNRFFLHIQPTISVRAFEQPSEDFAPTTAFFRSRGAMRMVTAATGRAAFHLLTVVLDLFQTGASDAMENLAQAVQAYAKEFGRYKTAQFVLSGFESGDPDMILRTREDITIIHWDCVGHAGYLPLAQISPEIREAGLKAGKARLRLLLLALQLERLRDAVRMQQNQARGWDLEVPADIPTEERIDIAAVKFHRALKDYIRVLNLYRNTRGTPERLDDSLEQPYNETLLLVDCCVRPGPEPATELDLAFLGLLDMRIEDAPGEH